MQRATTAATLEQIPALRIRHVLAAVDFSPPSKQALKYALSFARSFDAEVSLLHVTERIGFGIGDETSAQLGEANEQFETARKNLRALTSSSSFAGLRKSNVLIRQGLAPHQIVEVAKELDVDLIVLATHGYTGWRRLCVGSTAEHVVRTAPCPVLTVRAKFRGANPEKIRPRRILVPTDFSPCARPGFDYGLDLARKFGCQIVLLNVLGSNAREELAEAEKRLRSLANNHALVSSTVRRGHPPTEICKAASGANADLIVIATHGETSWRHFCLGSTSEAVVHAARCPVLVVREKEHELN